MFILIDLTTHASTTNKRPANHVTHTALPPNPTNHLRRSSASLIPDFSILRQNKRNKVISQK